MKKAVFLAIMAIGLCANAQFSISTNLALDYGKTSINETHSNNLHVFSVTPSVRAGYRWNEHFSAGLTFDLAYMHIGEQNNYSNPVLDLYNQGTYDYWISEHLNWLTGVFVRYDISLTQRLALFAEFTAKMGKAYGSEKRYNNTTKQLESHEIVTSLYGNLNNTVTCTALQLTPGVSFRFNSHWSAELYLDLLQIGYKNITMKLKEVNYSDIHPTSTSNNQSTYSYSTLSFGSNSLLTYNNNATDYALPYFLDAEAGKFRIGISYLF